MIHARILKRYAPGPDSAGFTLDVDLQTSAGVAVLFGPSGSGKTLTLDCIAGFVRPEEGRILADQQILFDAASGVHLSPQARQCGYVFQNYALFPHMTVRENLAFAGERLPRLERHRKVSEMLERFRLADVAGRRPHQISGGQKQRCSIARALIGSPRIVLLDEPGRGLDAPLRAELYDVVRQIRAEFGTPVLLVTHDLDECFELGEQMFILQDGKVAQTGSPAAILDKPAGLGVARLLGIYNLLPVEIAALDPGRNTSQLRVGEQTLAGPYFPGHLIGDRVWACCRPAQLQALPRNGRPKPNQLEATLQRAIEMPGGARLEFAGGIAVEMPRQSYLELRDTSEWVIEFPAGVLRVVG